MRRNEAASDRHFATASPQSDKCGRCPFNLVSPGKGSLACQCEIRKRLNELSCLRAIRGDGVPPGSSRER